MVKKKQVQGVVKRHSVLYPVREHTNEDKKKKFTPDDDGSTGTKLGKLAVTSGWSLEPLDMLPDSSLHALLNYSIHSTVLPGKYLCPVPGVWINRNARPARKTCDNKSDEKQSVGCTAYSVATQYLNFKSLLHVRMGRDHHHNH